MAVREIVTIGHPVLREPAGAVPEGEIASDEIQALVDDLVVLEAPDDLMAIGYWYEHFDATPDEAVLEHLARAHAAEPAHPEIAASYAHALVRTGQRPEAERVLGVALAGRATEVAELLELWSREPSVIARAALSG